MKKGLKIIGRIFIIVLLSTLIGYDIYLFNATYICNDALPMPFGSGTAVIMSGSMEPAISVFDVVVVQKADNYFINDIITYEENGKLVTHRIVEQNGDVYITRGDANNTEDPAISKEKVLGKVVRVIPSIGRVMLFLQKPIGMLCLMILLLGGMELSFQRTKAKKRKQFALVRAELDELKLEVKQISVDDVKTGECEAADDVMVRTKEIMKQWVPERIEKESHSGTKDDYDLLIGEDDDYDLEVPEYAARGNNTPSEEYQSFLYQLSREICEEDAGHRLNRAMKQISYGNSNKRGSIR